MKQAQEKNIQAKLWELQILAVLGCPAGQSFIFLYFYLISLMFSLFWVSELIEDMRKAISYTKTSVFLVRPAKVLYQ